MARDWKSGAKSRISEAKEKNDWHGCLKNTCPAAGINRARGFNNKGILNEYRKPKSAYHAVRQCYLEFARAESETNGKGEMKP